MMFIYKTAMLAAVGTSIVETLEIFVHRMITDHALFLRFSIGRQIF